MRQCHPKWTKATALIPTEYEIASQEWRPRTAQDFSTFTKLDGEWRLNYSHAPFSPVGAGLAWSCQTYRQNLLRPSTDQALSCPQFSSFGREDDIGALLASPHLTYLWTLARPQFYSWQIWEQSPSVDTDNVTRRNIRLHGASRARAKAQNTTHGHLLSGGCPTLFDVCTHRRRIARAPNHSERVVNGCRFRTLCHIEDSR